MFSSIVFWLIVLGSLALGVLAGWLMRQQLDPAARKLLLAQRQLEEAQLALRSYRTQVTDHFKGTAERVNRLTEDYRDLHQHLADGAFELCEEIDNGQQPLLTSLSNSAYRPDFSLSAASVAPPLDYAPKKPVQKPGARTDDDDLDRVVDD